MSEQAPLTMAVEERADYFRTVWVTPRAAMEAFLEQCTCMNAEDRSVLWVLMADLVAEPTP